MDTARFKQKAYHDLHSKERNFDKDQTVWVKRDNKIGSKWQAGTVTGRTAPLTYTVNIGGQAYRQHADHLRNREEQNIDRQIHGEPFIDDNQEQQMSDLHNNENEENIRQRPRRVIHEPRHILRDQYVYYK